LISATGRSRQSVGAIAAEGEGQPVLLCEAVAASISLLSSRTEKAPNRPAGAEVNRIEIRA